MISLTRLALGTCVLGSFAAVPVFRGPTPIQLDPSRIDAVFKAYTRTTPGCALGIYHDGAIAYQKGYGMADLTFDIPITPATLFDIGSTSKQFAAASIVLLANDGRIALSDDVRKYIPELPDYGTTITIDHMLRHTSGLRDYNGLLFLAGFKYEDATDDDDALRLIALQKATNFGPGSKWDYSNTGFFLLSVIVKRVTGKNLAEFAKERLFVPLGMTKTNFRNDHTVILKARATAYDPAESGGYQIDMSNWDQLGDGAINTNVIEMAKWDENFYTGKVGGRPLIDKLYQRGTLSTGDSLSYARGLFVDTYRGVRRIHHGGAWAGYRAMLMRFPEQHVSVATLCNRSDANTTKLAEGVADVVLGNVFKAAERKVVAASGSPKTTNGASSGDVTRFAGVYFSEAEQSVVHIDQKDGKLELGFSGAKIPLKPAGENRFEADGFPVAIAFTGDEMEMWIAKESRGKLQKVSPVTLTASDWNQLAGTYYSPELDTSWKLEVKDGKATLGGRSVGHNPLEPAFADAFSSGPGFVRFTRDSSGRLTGFDFSASRMQTIRFDRK
ncbi:MAG: serine hydrolase domain-containing protein [Gemmatimonadota bacterium]